MNELFSRVEALRGVLASHPPKAPSAALAEAALECCRELIEAGEGTFAVVVARESLERLSADDPRWVVSLTIELIRALSAIGAASEAREAGESCLATHAETLAVEPALSAKLRVWMAATTWQLNRAGEALVILGRVRGELLQRPDSSLLGWCSYQMAAAYLLVGERQLARRFNWEAIVSARRAEDASLEAYALRALGMLESASARWSIAQEAFTEARALSDKFGLGLIRGTSDRGLGIVMWKRGLLGQAAKYAKNSEENKLISHHRYHPILARILASAIECHAGRFAVAEQRIADASRDLTQLPPDSRPALLTTEFLGDIQLEQGHAEQALARYDEVWPKALALVPKGDIVAELRRRRAECYYLLGRFAEAHAEALAGLDHCRELGDRYEEAATYRVLALSTAAIGRPADAKKWFDQGFAYYDDIETPYEWGKLWLAYGDWLNGPHAGEYANRKTAIDAYHAAADHFERMGAQAKLAEANARVAALTPPAAAQSGAATEGAAPRARRPARKPRAAAELERRSAWARETFGFITRNPAVLGLLEDVAKLARSDAPILVLGESGTGKELVAGGVHRLSGRSGLFVPINCGAIPREMIESELFGHVAGAFTGAMRDKPGIFEACDGGTVFLDEIGEMSLDLQSRLLRFLERNEARRVGSNKNYSVDTRVVAATNRDRTALERGEGFRSDLYYRLAHAVITLPPLRRRGDDLDLLIDQFLAEFATAEEKRLELSEATRERLRKHTWPGNVRQLRAVLRRVVLLGTPGHVVEPEHLQLDEGTAPTTLLEELEQAEKVRIVEALAQAKGSRTIAARALGMPRTTLINKMQRHGLI